VSIGQFGKFVEDAVINWMRGATFPAPPGGLWLSLWTTLPAKDGTGGVEVTGSGYARLAIALPSPTTVDGAEQTSNAGAWNFPTAGGSWGSIVGVAIHDASGGGNLLMRGLLTVGPIVVSTGTVAHINAGNLTIVAD
jgi:hypothetical protein